MFNITSRSTMQKVAALFFVSLFAAAPQAMAQKNLLKGLAGAAAQKVGSKVLNKVVDAAVDKTVDKATEKVEQKLAGTKAGKVIETAKTIKEAEGNVEEGERTYPASLGPSPEMEDFYRFYVDEESLAIPSFSSIADVLKAFPALPAPQQMSDRDAMEKYYINLKSFSNGFSQLLLQRSMKSAEMGMAMQGRAGVPGMQISAGARSYMDRLFAVVMQLPEAERNKIEEMAENDKDGTKTLAYIKSNHPDLYKTFMDAPADLPKMDAATDARIEEYSDIIAKVEPLTSKMAEDVEKFSSSMNLTALMAGGLEDALLGRASELGKLHKAIAAEWLTSEEFAKVKAMEEDLTKRAHEWEEENAKFDKFGAEPPFWKEECEKQNAVIDAFNARVAERWIATLQTLLDADMPNFKLLAEQDAHLVALVPQNDTEKSMYYLAQQTISTCAMSVMMGISSYIDYIFSVPFVEHTSTDFGM